MTLNLLGVERGGYILLGEVGDVEEVGFAKRAVRRGPPQLFFLVLAELLGHLLDVALALRHAQQIVFGPESDVFLAL